MDTKHNTTRTSGADPDAELYDILDRIAATEREIDSVDKARTAAKRAGADPAQLAELGNKSDALVDERGHLCKELTYCGPSTRNGFVAWYRAIVAFDYGCDGTDDFWHLAFWLVRRAERLGITEVPKLPRELQCSQTAKRLEGLWRLAAEERAAA